MTRIYTAEEVSLHNNEKDLWIAIHGGVYDLTKFLKEHPGGEEVLLNSAGLDGTICFDDNGHSEEALQLREAFRVGDYASGDPTRDSTGQSATSSVTANSGTKEVTTDDDDWEYQEIKPETSKWVPIFAAIGVVIYAVIFYYFWF